MFRVQIALLIAVLTLTGCGRGWAAYDTAGTPFKRGSADCKYKAAAQSSSSAANSRNGRAQSGLPAVNHDGYRICMIERGY